MHSKFSRVFGFRKILPLENIIAPSPYNVASQYPNNIRVGHEAALRKIRPQRRIVRMSLKQRGHAMRTFDFAPFYRSTVGFDQLFSMLDQVSGAESAAAPGYPPYNIKRSGENAYNISVAVAGFAGADLSIEVKENVLTIRGNKQSSGEEESDLIYQGIAERNFERKFQLADHVQIKGASLENGLLQVDLLRVVPEAMKPRAIPITTAKKAVLEAKTAKIAA